MDNTHLIEVNPIFEAKAKETRLLLRPSHGADRREELDRRIRGDARGYQRAIRDRARYLPRMAYQDAGGLPASHARTRSPRPSTSPRAPRSTMSGRAYETGLPPRLQGGHDLPRRLARLSGSLDQADRWARRDRSPQRASSRSVPETLHGMTEQDQDRVRQSLCHDQQP